MMNNPTPHEPGLQSAVPRVVSCGRQLLWIFRRRIRTKTRAVHDEAVSPANLEVSQVTPAVQGRPMEPDIDRFYRKLVRDTADAIVYSDADGLIGFWNAGAERVFGFSAAEAIGKSLDIIIPEPLRQRHWSGYRESVRSGKSRYGMGDVLAVPALRKDGTRISVEFTILPFHDKAGRTLGMAATLRDVTKRFDEMKALRAAVAAKR